jgi:hypothetical protein
MYGQLCQNVLHFDYPDMPAATGLQNAAADLEANWLSQIRLPISANVQWNSIRMDELSTGGAGLTHTRLVTILGAQPVDSFIILNIAWKLRFQTGLSGRHNRGRCFIPGVRSGWMNSGFMHASGIAAWTAPVAALIGRYCVGGSGFMKLHIRRTFGGTHDTIPVTTMQISNTPGSMRSRMIGVGA